jgi:MFS family permease
MQSTPTVPPPLIPAQTAEIELSRIRSQQPPLSSSFSERESEERGLIDAITYPTLSQWKTFTIISTVTGITVLNSMQNGIVTVGLPTIGRDLGINQNLILWFLPVPNNLISDYRPSSVYSLACGCFLLFTGQLADVLGSRVVFLSGCLLYATFTLASGLSQTPLQLILFRAMQGLSIAACLPSAVGILSLSFPTGGTRNLGFAILGAGQPVGFASGMVLSGVFISKLSWRWAFYCSAMVNLLVFAGACWGLPKVKVFEPVRLETFWRRVDWIGAALVSTSLGLFFYVLAYFFVRMMKLMG